jgi:dienelactone hydrolase
LECQGSFLVLNLLMILACAGDKAAAPETEASGTQDHTTSVDSVQTTTPAKHSVNIADQLGMNRLSRAENEAIFGLPLNYEHYTLRPLSLQIFPDFRVSGALYEPKQRGKHPAFLMAHGHFGEGKSSGEAQAPAHALAHRGYVVLAMDTPGVEEGDQKGRQIHLEAGLENREELERAGTTAMALQLHGLQAGLDYFNSRDDIDWIGVGGASGGAVQAFYLSQIDTRPEALVMASFVPMPRENKSGGCACDWVPGGWNDDLVSKLDIPNLWMSEGAEAKPDGLGPKGLFVTHPGPHGFERPMIDEALRWMDGLHSLEIDRRLPDQLPHAPASALASETVGNASISNLLSSPPTNVAK